MKSSVSASIIVSAPTPWSQNTDRATGHMMDQAPDKDPGLFPWAGPKIWGYSRQRPFIRPDADSDRSSGPTACAGAVPPRTSIAGIEPAIVTTNERMDTRSSPRIVDWRETVPA
jgi:hypothetical protein